MSLSPKTVRWLDANCPGRLQGKTVLVTGANSGIGFKTAETMVYLGAKVILACRNGEKAEAARSALAREYPGACVDVRMLDLADLSSVDAFAETLRRDHTDIDVFVNNAGVFHHPGRKTADGFELVLGTNYIGVYALCEKVLPYLASLPHEVTCINTVSLIHKAARRIDYKDFWYEKHYRNIAVYARSKLCLAKYTYALARRYAGTNVRAVMSHPGIAVTPLGLEAYGFPDSRAVRFFSRCFNSPEKSSLSAAWILAHRPEPGSITGPDRLFGGWGYPKQNRVMKKVKTGAEELIRFTDAEIARARHPEG